MQQIGLPLEPSTPLFDKIKVVLHLLAVHPACMVHACQPLEAALHCLLTASSTVFASEPWYIVIAFEPWYSVVAV